MYMVRHYINVNGLYRGAFGGGGSFFFRFGVGEGNPGEGLVDVLLHLLAVDDGVQERRRKERLSALIQASCR